jgi:DNA-binding transcriptional LysR family regulator
LLQLTHLQADGRLGDPLLERTGRGIKATAAGMALLAHSEQIDRAVNSAVQSLLQLTHLQADGRLGDPQRVGGG